MMTYHPKAGAIWTQTRNGAYYTDKSFYDESGGIFDPSAHYVELFKNAGKWSDAKNLFASSALTACDLPDLAGLLLRKKIALGKKRDFVYISFINLSANL